MFGQYNSHNSYKIQPLGAPICYDLCSCLGKQFVLFYCLHDVVQCSISSVSHVACNSPNACLQTSFILQILYNFRNDPKSPHHRVHLCFGALWKEFPPKGKNCYQKVASRRRNNILTRCSLCGLFSGPNIDPKHHNMIGAKSVISFLSSLIGFDSC